MRELAGFLAAALLAVVGIAGLVALQRDGDDPSPPASPGEVAAAVAPGVPPQDRLAGRNTHVIILVRPDQSTDLPSLYPHVPPELLDRTSAHAFDSSISLDEIRETTFYLTSSMVKVDYVDLRDR